MNTSHLADRTEPLKGGLESDPFGSPDERILILAPTGSDARLTTRLLLRAGLNPYPCSTVTEANLLIPKGCGALLVAEEALNFESVALLSETLSTQPTWSDLPIAVITSGGEATQNQLRRISTLGPFGNVTLVERPFRAGTLISTLEVALRSRRRQYEVRNLMVALCDAHARIEATLEAAEVGTWVWNLPEDRVVADKNLARLFNLRATAGFSGRAGSFLRHIHREDQKRIKDAIAQALEGTCDSLEIDCRLPQPDGTDRWVTARGRLERNSLGEAVRFAGVVIDISEQKKQQHSMALLARRIEDQARLFNITLSSINDLAYCFDLEGNWTYANQPLLNLWGRKLEDIVGKSSLELGYPEELAERLRQQVKEVVRTRQPVRGETYFTSSAGVEDYHEYIFSPVFGADGQVTAVCGTTRLTTERKRAEAVAESHRRVLQLMAEDRPLREVLETLMRTVELACTTRAFASIFLLESDGIHLRVAAAPNLPKEFVRAVDGVAIGPAVGSSGTAVFTKRPVYVSDIAHDPLWASHRDLALSHGLRASWAVPIFSSQGSVLGTFAIYHSEPREASANDLHVVEMATRTAVIAIERKRKDVAIRESQQRYSQLLHALPTAVFTTDAQGRITLYNEAAATLWGRRPIIGREFWSGTERLFRTDGTPIPLDQCPIAVSARDGRPVRGTEMIIERPDGTRRNVLPHPEPIRDGSGHIVGAVDMLLDITDSKQAEAASRRLAAIVESSNDAIISKDLNGIITSWNAGAERLFGYRSEEIIGRPVTDLMPPAQRKEEPSVLRHIRLGERVEHYETIRQHKDGHLVEISLTVSPIRDYAGNIVGASKIMRDISEQKQAERRLERAHQEVVAASKAKDEFLAALSHELRTPLNPVLLLSSEAAEDPSLPAAVRTLFATIRNNVELEARLIDDLLDITRITHGKLRLDLVRCQACQVLRAAIATVATEVEQKQIRLSEDLADTDCEIMADPVRLQQVFWNVLKNAIKFTPQGGEIRVRTLRQDEDWLVEVRDTGIGMTPRDLAVIFEAFAQGTHGAKPEETHRFGGLGLGLAISRRLVESHQGTIQAESPGLDQGSLFCLTIPLARPMNAEHPSSGGDSARPVPAAAGVPPALSILLVEDHEATRTTLAQLLTRRRFLVSPAASIAEARALATQHDFHILVSDIGLPDGTGFDLMAELQARHPELLGVALTGYGMEVDMNRSRAAGFSVHLTKPVRVQSLDAALAGLTHRIRTGAT